MVQVLLFIHILLLPVSSEAAYNIGFEDEVVGRALTGLPAGARLHAVGIGSAPNRSLTRGAARAGSGVELIVNTDGETDAVAARLVCATACPVLTDLAVFGTAVRALAPHPRDVFAGQPLVLALELSPPGGTVEVSGRLAGENNDWRQRILVGSLEAVTAGSSASESVAGGRTALPLGALFGREAIAEPATGSTRRSPRGSRPAPASWSRSTARASPMESDGDFPDRQDEPEQLARRLDRFVAHRSAKALLLKGLHPRQTAGAGRPEHLLFRVR